MANLKLPDIEPARSFGNAEAAAIEQAGSAFQQGMQSIARIPYELDKARLVSQTTSAADELLAINRLKNLPAAEPTVSADRAKELFGGVVPEGVKLDETVTNAAGKEVTRPRASIPTHELLPHLFDRTAQVAMANAKAKISEPGWAKKFEEAAKSDIEKARQEMYDFTIAQHRQEMKAKGVARAQDLAAVGEFPRLAALYSDPTWGWTPAEQEKGLAEIPHLQTERMLSEGIRAAATSEALDALESKVSLNEVGKDKLYAPLAPEQQSHYLQVIGAKRKALAEAEYQAKLAPYDLKMQQIENGVFGDPRAYLLAHPEVRPPEGIKDEDFNVRRDRQNRLLEGKPVQDDTWRYLSIYNNPGKAKALSQRQFYDYVHGHFTPAKEEELMRFYADLQTGKASEAPAIPKVTQDAVNHAVMLKMGKTSLNDMNLEQQKEFYSTVDSLSMRALEEIRKNPEKPLTFNQLYGMLEAQQAPSTEAKEGLFFETVMDPAKRRAQYGLTDPAQKAVWEDAWRAAKGASPASDNALIDMIHNARKEWGAVVESEWGKVSHLAPSGALTATVLARLSDPARIAEIDKQIGVNPDPKVQRLRRVHAAIQLSTPDGAEGLQTRMAEIDAATVVAEQLKTAAAQPKTFSESIDERVRARMPFPDRKPQPPKRPAGNPLLAGAQDTQADLAAWEQRKAKHDADVEAAIQSYRQYVARHGIDLNAPDAAAKARNLPLGLEAYVRQFQEGPAP